MFKRYEKYRFIAESGVGGRVGRLIRWRGWQQRLQAAWRETMELIFPSPRLCRICGCSIDSAAAVDACRSCLRRLPVVTGRTCRFCGRPLPAASGGLCHDCRRIDHFYTRNQAVGIYTGALKEWIRELKYNYNRHIALPLGQVMGIVARHRSRMEGALARSFLSRPFDTGVFRPFGGQSPQPSKAGVAVSYLVPVPVHSSRLQERGYNQARLLAEAASPILGVPVIEEGIVVRRAATGPSSRLSPSERRANLRGAFRVVRPAAVAGKVLCVVDDIYTTGATLDEMARTLLQAGAAAVYGLTLSIAVHEEDLVQKVEYQAAE